MHWNKPLATVLLCASAALASAQASPEASQPQSLFVHKKKYVMGTVFEIVAYGESPAQLSNALDLALQEVVRLDAVMSDYKPESALSRLNHSSHSRPQRVPPDLYRVIGEALQYSRLSGGKFDVTVGPLVNLWKAAIRGGQPPSSAEEEKVRACAGYQKVELLPPDWVRFHSPCTQIDLGAIGKGYALDRAADRVARARYLARPAGCRRKHATRAGYSSGAGRLAGASERSIEPDKSRGDAVRQQRLHLGANPAQPPVAGARRTHSRSG